MMKGIREIFKAFCSQVRGILYTHYYERIFFIVGLKILSSHGLAAMLFQKETDLKCHLVYEISRRTREVEKKYQSRSWS